MCSQNGTGKLVAKRSTRQGLGGMWLGTGGDSLWGWHGLGSVWARERGASGGCSGAGVQQCRGVSAMQGGSAPGTVLQQRGGHQHGWAPSACHVPDWSGREREGTVCLQ